jgi:hypothetical protein
MVRAIRARGRTPRETIAQALEYASWVEVLEYDALEQVFQDYTGNDTQSLQDYHKAYFKLSEDDVVSFNKDQRIVIVGYDITPEIRQTALFLRKKKIRATCVEFNYFQDPTKEQLMTIEIVVGKEPVTKGRLETAKRTPTDRNKFMNDLDENARSLFNDILSLAEKQHFVINWGSVGFSLNVDIENNYVALLMGYPRSSVFGQTIYTYVPSALTKVKDAKKLVDSFKQKLSQTGLFIPAGNEMKYVVKQKPTEEQVKTLLSLIVDFAEQIELNGLNE